MRRLADFLFGSLAPFVEVMLVLAGLGLLGWGGVAYTLTGTWPPMPVGMLWIGGPVGGITAWLLGLPLPGTCFAVAIAMFFVMPPAYQHA